jgi:predicted RNA-binding Zn ribbon-like protein
MVSPFFFVGERLCLDFINTQIVDNGEPVDLLRSFDDLIAWLAAAQVIDESQAKALKRHWSGSSGGREVERAFRQAIELRSALRAVAERLADGRTSVPQPTLDRINDILRGPSGSMELMRAKDGRYETRFRRYFRDPGDLLAPIAESVATMLSGDDLSLVKKCQGPRCILFFYDTTRNHGRRWCSMTACGNRAKVAAHYKRSRQEAS